MTVKGAASSPAPLPIFSLYSHCFTRFTQNLGRSLIGRKNFLFANTSLGAQASAVIYTLIETAKETGLDPFRYLVWLLKTAPTLDRTMDSWATTLLPANAPDACRIP